MMKNKKALLIVLIVVWVIVVVGGMIGFVAWRISEASSKQIEDINGEDDKTLAVITNEDIESGRFSSVSFGSSTHTEGYRASGVREHYYRDMDNTYLKRSIKQFSGISIENTYLGNGSPVTYALTSTVSSGNFQIFITDEDFQILKVVPIDQSVTLTIPTEAGKLYHVIFVGESAEIQAELWRTMQ